MTESVAHAPSSASRPRPTARRSGFYVAMGLAAIAAVIAGFGPGLAAGAATRRGAPTPLVWAHSAVFFSWLVLYVSQAHLIRAGNRRAHMRLGWMAAALAPFIVGIGYATTIEQGRRGFALWWPPDIAPDPIAELVHPLGDLLSFTLLTTAAFILRRRADVHKRLMLLATVGPMMGAPLAHLVSYFPAARQVPPVILLPLGLFYFSAAIYERVRQGRVHPVSVWGGVALFAFAVVRAALIGPSAAWHAFAARLLN